MFRVLFPLAISVVGVLLLVAVVFIPALHSPALVVALMGVFTTVGGLGYAHAVKR